MMKHVFSQICNLEGLTCRGGYLWVCSAFEQTQIPEKIWRSLTDMTNPDTQRTNVHFQHTYQIYVHLLSQIDMLNQPGIHNPWWLLGRPPWKSHFICYWHGNPQCENPPQSNVHQVFTKMNTHCWWFCPNFLLFFLSSCLSFPLVICIYIYIHTALY